MTLCWGRDKKEKLGRTSAKRLRLKRTQPERRASSLSPRCPLSDGNVPVIVSDKITALTPDTFWLGGGETDLKMSFRADAFLAATDAFVVDCTY